VQAIYMIVNTDSLADQAAEGVQRQPAGRSLHAVLVQFRHHQTAPLSPESFLGQMPATAGHGSQRQNNQKPRRADEKASREGARSIRRRSERFLRRLEKGGHGSFR